VRHVPRIRVLEVLLSVAVLVMLGALAARADCLSDCRNAYEAAMPACQQSYGAAESEVRLQECMDAASATYGTCVDACETED
jgi:hypothetical protein